MKAQSLNHWTTRGVPLVGFEKAVDKGSRGNEENVTGNLRKRGEICYIVVKNLTELSPTVVWKAELLRDKLGYLGEQIFKC